MEFLAGRGREESVDFHRRDKSAIHPDSTRRTLLTYGGLIHHSRGQQNPLSGLLAASQRHEQMERWIGVVVHIRNSWERYRTGWSRLGCEHHQHYIYTAPGISPASICKIPFPTAWLPSECTERLLDPLAMSLLPHAAAWPLNCHGWNTTGFRSRSSSSCLLRHSRLCATCSRIRRK